MHQFDYEEDIKKEAISFLEDNLEAVKDGLTDEQDNLDAIQGHDLRDSFHGHIVDRSYTPEDAVAVLQNSDNEETDSGIWEGLDWRDQLSARAAYTFGNDVWFKAEEIFKELSELVAEKISECQDANEDWDDIEIGDVVEKVLKDWQDERKVQPVTDAKEELVILEEWLTRNQRDAGMRSGYPLGSSYIDSRCGTGHGMPEIKAFVEFDHETARKVLGMAGKYRDAIIVRIAELKAQE